MIDGNLQRVYLLLGSNLGDREAILEQAVIELVDRLLPDYMVIDSLEEAVNTSKVYESEPWGFNSKDKFLNQAFCCVTELEPEEVLSACLEIEKELGRERVGEQFNEQGERVYSSRLIDIDVLLIEEKIDSNKWEWVAFNSPTLSVPHPRLKEREFALKPLREITTRKF